MSYGQMQDKIVKIMNEKKTTDKSSEKEKKFLKESKVGKNP